MLVVVVLLMSVESSSKGWISVCKYSHGSSVPGGRAGVEARLAVGEVGSCSFTTGIHQPSSVSPSWLCVCLNIWTTAKIKVFCSVIVTAEIWRMSA